MYVFHSNAQNVSVKIEMYIPGVYTGMYFKWVPSSACPLPLLHHLAFRLSVMVMEKQMRLQALAAVDSSRCVFSPVY